MKDITRLTEAAHDRDHLKQAVVEILDYMEYLDSCDNVECAMATDQAHSLLRQAMAKLEDAREVVSRLGRQASRTEG